MKKSVILLGSIFTLLLSSFAIPVNRNTYQEPQATVCMDIPGGKVCYEQDTPTSTYTPMSSTITATDEISTETQTPTSTVTITFSPTSTITPTPTTASITNTKDFIPLEFVEHASSAVTGSISTNWAFPGTALTASTLRFYANYLQGRHVVYAAWSLAWNPTAGTIPTGVRIVKFDNGPSNIEELASLLVSNTMTPIGSGADLTNQIQTMIDSGTFKHLGEQTVGNGTNGCLIYSSVIYIILE